MPSKFPRMSLTDWILRMVIAIVLDIIDLFFGWIPGVGTILDIIGLIIVYMLWGKYGLIYVWEVIAFGSGNAVDGFVPTATLVGLYLFAAGHVKTSSTSRKKGNKYGKRKKK